jgi:hypothetical protein
MSTSILPDDNAVLTAVGKLFDDKPPVLVEVRFPKMGTSPDWFLCESAAALEAILERLGPGAEVHLSRSGAVVFRPVVRREQ